jgi:hypothetical protein
MYWNAIIWFLTWPLLIVIAWFLVKYIVNKYKNTFEKVEE